MTGPVVSARRKRNALRRVARGGALMAYTGMSVRDIGLDCGFASLAQFSRQYKARFGFAPSQTRKLG